MTGDFSSCSEHNPRTPASNTHAFAVLRIHSHGEFEIRDVATVGRSPECQITVDDRSVSRLHARIFFEGGHFWLKDLESANGTFVDGKRVRLQMLASAAEITFGSVKALFHITGAGTGPAPIARDPLEGAVLPADDGTPTGGLAGAGRTSVTATGSVSGLAATTGSRFESAASTASAARIGELEQENARLKAELQKLRAATGGISAGESAGHQTGARSADESPESERLKRVVKQLERALADSNIRIRNLQERLSQLENHEPSG